MRKHAPPEGPASAGPPRPDGSCVSVGSARRNLSLRCLPSFNPSESACQSKPGFGNGDIGFGDRDYEANRRNSVFATGTASNDPGMRKHAPPEGPASAGPPRPDG